MTDFSYSQSFGTTTVSGSTPYGTFDSDSVFTVDCQKTAKWISRRLGYPIMNVELDDLHLYGAYEEAALKYNSIITSHQAANWFLDYIGERVSSSYDNFTGTISKADLSFIKRITEPFSLEAGVGGKAPLYSGSFGLAPNQQIYDLKQWATTSESGYNIIVKDIYHAPTPAMIRTPYMNFTGGSWQWDWYQSEYSSYGVPVGSFAYQIWPAFSNIQREQAIEMQTTVRRSQYSYVLHDNVVRITPTPNEAMTIWFTYYREDPNKEYSIEQSAATVTGSDTHHIITNIANIPMQAITFKTLNAIAKDWIRRYALAISKEILGLIRGKISSIAVPGAEITLDGDTLRTEGKDERTELVEELKATLEDLTFERLLEKKSSVMDSIKSITSKIPFKTPIMIG